MRFLRRLGISLFASAKCFQRAKDYGLYPPASKEPMGSPKAMIDRHYETYYIVTQDGPKRVNVLMMNMSK